MKDCYCGACQQQREAKDLSIYYSDTSKALRCNFCLDDDHQKDLVKNQEIERIAKRKANICGLTQSQLDYSKSDGAIDKLATRRAIEDFNDRKLINELIGE
jgi:hypothetical protein